ncbi:MAG: aminoglycoside phosphotransferase family protein [Ruminococcaceae bacterium]|nr:aminoglycoside phosphotransferase family protein [Oscillospiraceae bacterium]
MKSIENAINYFLSGGEILAVEEISAGNINSTYKVVYSADGKKSAYVFQRINTYVFKNPEQLMDNVVRVITHIDGKLDKNDPDYDRRLLRFIRSPEGGYLYSDNEGGSWRAYVFVDGVTAHNFISDPKMFYEAGRGFGEFQRQLFDFPADELYETIPNFHNTKSRYGDFLAAVKEDKAGRAESVKAEIDFLVERKDMMSAIVDMLESGELPVRVTHNDTKLNNVLLDDKSGKAICVIDLDTVMPGSSLYDYGDAIRYGANTAAEDEADLSKIKVDMELFKLFTKGFVEETSSSLEKNEIRHFPLGAKVMTCELVMRFLTDYLNGDVYFKIADPEHNLRRTRAQMKLLCEIEANYDEMMSFVESML